MSSYTDTYGKVIRYEYDAVGNLSKIIYPDNTAVTYAYDANHNLVRVTDWANRVTSYTYDVNNRVVGVTKPDGSVTTTVYDNKQRVTSTVERTAGGVVITGFEYTYDDLSRIVEEKVLANSTKMCYTYDSLNRVTARTIRKLSDNSVVSTETFAYDTYGKLISRTGTSKVIFGYNGRDGVVTDDNGLIYMRARYYSPAMKRFINADVVAGAISNAITLNRFAYANGNPVSFVDPFGLWGLKGAWNSFTNWVSDTANDVKDWAVDTANAVKDWAVDTANNVKDWAVDSYNDAKNTVVETVNEVKDWAVDTYNDVKERAVDTYNDVKEWVEDAKVAVKDFGEKAGNAFLNSIEAEAGVGYGFGKSFKAGIFEIEVQAYSDNFTVRLDDNEVFMDNSGSAGISANILDQKKMSFGVSSSYHHDYVDRPNDCKEHHAWSNPFSVATCEHADKTPMSFSVPIKGSIGADKSEDVVLGISGATHIGVGYHYSVGFNFSQFWGELWE